MGGKNFQNYINELKHRMGINAQAVNRSKSHEKAQLLVENK